MFATSLALIGQEFHGKDRATAFGVWGATVGGAVAIGPLVGGLITEHLGWEWIFFVNVPIGIGGDRSHREADRQRRRRGPRADRLSPASITFSLGALPAHLRPDPRQPGGLGEPADRRLAGRRGVLLVVFVAIELRSSHPMLDLEPLPQTGLQRRLGGRLLPLGGDVRDVPLPDPLHPGRARLRTAEAGLRFLPMTVLSFIVSPIAGALSNRIPIRVLLGVGLGSVGVGLLLMPAVSVDSTWTALLAGFLLTGIGIGIDQPRHRPGGDRRRPGREIGDGLGDQHHLPPGRDRHRGRRRSGRSSSRGSTRSSPSSPAARAARGSANWSPRAARARSKKRSAPRADAAPTSTRPRRPSSAASTRSS